MRVKLKVSGYPLLCCTYSKSYEFISIGCEDSVIYIYSAFNGNLALMLKGHTYGVLTSVFNPDDNRVHSAGKEKQVFTWDITQTSIISKYSGHASDILDIKVKDTNTVLTASLDGTGKIWDLRSKKVVQTLNHATDGLLSINCSKNEIITASSDGVVRIYDIRHHKVHCDTLDSVVSDLDLYLDNKHYLAILQEGLIKTIDKNNGKLLQYTSITPFQGIQKCKLMNKDKFIVYGNSKGNLSMYDQSFNLVNEIPCHTGYLRDIATHKSENKCITVGDDGFLHIIDN